MALLAPTDRVLETSTTTGTGTYTMSGTAVTGYQTLSVAVGAVNGTTAYYYAEDVDANGVPLGGWETGLGTWNTGNTLTRTTINTSSNANAAVSWAAGTRRISFALTATQLAAGVLALKSATTTVNVSAAAAPTTGQVLTATSGTAATWQTPSGSAAGLESNFLLMGA